jgi:hypothetical protein
MKKKGLRIVGLVIIEGALLAGLVWLLGINRTEWIIRMGILQADRLIMVSWIAWIILAALINLFLLFTWLKRRKHMAAAPIKLTFSPDKVQDPAEMQKELTRFIAERPQLEPLLQQGLDQLENIARKKEKMNEILDRNEVSLLSEASDALGDAEQTLCRKLILVLNRALLCDPEEENASRKQEVYAEHARYIQTFLSENEDVLNRCEKLLAETVRYVEEKKAGSDDMDLQIMTDVIHSLYNDGIRMDVK